MMKTILTILGIVLCTTIVAQRRWDNAMRLNTCNITINASEFTATTHVEMEFCNDGKIELEGLYRFQLKPHQVITDFQLMLDGKYRDGSIEEKWKANNTYNSIVGKRIDPAILQMEYQGQYSLRIYPVPAGGCRKITFTILEKLREANDLLHYSLPISNIGEVQNFNVQIKTTNVPIPILSGILKEKTFDNKQLNYTVILAPKNDSIYFATPINKEINCTKTVEDITYFALRYQPEKVKEGVLNAKNVCVFWDISASKEFDDKVVQIDFLKKYIEKNSIEQIALTTFNYKVHNTINFNAKNWNTLYKYLHGIRYTGATQLGAVNLDVPNADVVLLFTDGKSNYGKSDPKTGTTPIFAIVTTGENNLKLSNIIGLTGGSIIAINKDNLGNSVQKATVIKELLLNITANNGLLTLDQNLDTFLQSKTTLSGQISAAASELIFHYGNFKSGSQKVIKISKNNDCTNSSIERMNMLSKFEKINANYGWENSLLFGRTEKIITQQTAYLVLERIEDYIKYQITPPKDIEHIVKNNPSYVAAPKLDPVKFSKEEVELSYLKGIAIYYNQRIAEWDKAQKQIDIASIKSNTQLKYERKVEQEIAAKKEFASSLENMDAREINIGKSFMENDKALNSEVVVVSVGYGSKKQFMAGAVSSVNSNQLLGYNNLAQALQGRVPGLQVYQNSNPGAVPSIRLRGASSFSGNGNPLFVLDGMPITDDYALNILNPNDIQNVTVLRDLQAAALYGSRAYNGAIVINTKKGKYYYQNIFSSYKLKNQEDVEYINEFKETDKTYQYAKYLELRKLHGFDKTFYFDIAELFYLQGSAETAKEIISNAVEIAEENSNVLQAVAFYFDKWGMYEDAQELYKQLIEKNPSGLQYYRNLALSYQLQGKYQEALNTYNEAILIAVNAPVQKALVLNELNALIGAQQGKLDLEAINPALIKVLPMEVRIVVETNSYNYQTAMVSTKNVQLNKNSNHYNSYYYNQNGCLPLQEFLYKEAKEKKFEVQVNYYGNYYTPDVYRIITYKNFGKANQTINVENVILDNQYGKVSIHEFNL